MDPKQRVGLLIKTLRKRKKWTQPQLAERIHRTVDGVSNLERGASLPSYETLVHLSRELGVPVADFFNFEGGEKITARRTRTLITLMEMIRSLNDRDLDVVVNMVEALLAGREGDGNRSGEG